MFLVGDSLLNESEYEELRAKAIHKRKKSKRKNDAAVVDNTLNAINNTEISARKKKRLKQKRRQKERSSESKQLRQPSQHLEKNDEPVIKTDKNALKKLQIECGLVKSDSMGWKISENVPLPNANHVASINETEVVVYSNPSSSKRKNHVTEEDNVDVNETDTEKKTVKIFSMNKARHEVLKLGISGFEKEKKKDAEVALAIKLGAKVSFFLVVS